MQAPCVPHGIDADGTYQLIGDVSVQDGAEDFIFHDPSHEKSEKGLLQPDVGAGGLQGHGKGRWIGSVKGAQGEYIHDAPHELGHHAGGSGGTVLHAHVEPEAEKRQIFFHMDLRSEAFMRMDITPFRFHTAGTGRPGSRRCFLRPGGCRPACRP